MHRPAVCLSTPAGSSPTHLALSACSSGSSVWCRHEHACLQACSAKLHPASRSQPASELLTSNRVKAQPCLLCDCICWCQRKEVQQTLRQKAGSCCPANNQQTTTQQNGQQGGRDCPRWVPSAFIFSCHCFCLRTGVAAACFVSSWPLLFLEAAACVACTAQLQAARHSTHTCSVVMLHTDENRCSTAVENQQREQGRGKLRLYCLYQS